jgi:hypothetical protein
MAQLTLNVGSFVTLPHIAATTRTVPATFLIQELLTLDDGLILYKVKSEAEPFDRIVDERELVLQAPGV